ncbi:hypothetical protein Q9966_015770 [Columba livia]|nr:hypothetical protein Q9966_015770 [Columba livia]
MTGMRSDLWEEAPSDSSEVPGELFDMTPICRISCGVASFAKGKLIGNLLVVFSTSERISPQNCLPCQQYKLQNELLLNLNLGIRRGYAEQVKTQKQSDMPWLCRYADTSNHDNRHSTGCAREFVKRRPSTTPEPSVKRLKDLEGIVSQGGITSKPATEERQGESMEQGKQVDASSRLRGDKEEWCKGGTRIRAVQRAVEALSFGEDLERREHMGRQSKPSERGGVQKHGEQEMLQLWVAEEEEGWQA